MAPTRPPGLPRALRVLLVLGGLLLALLVAVPFGVDGWVRQKYEPTIAGFQQELTENIDFFCEQQALLAREPWFHEPRTQGDAGALLNAWVAWENGPGLPEGSPLAIPAHLPRHSWDFRDWASSQADVSTLDFGWMERLHEYDRWELLDATRLPPGKSFNLLIASLPDFESLVLWARFRLLHGLRSGQPLAAARDVRQLAWLVYRTDTVQGGRFAASLLEAEHEAYLSLRSPPPEWRPVPPAQLARMRALMLSSIPFSSIAAPVEVAKRARSCGEPAVTRRAALGEAASMMKYLERFAREMYPASYALLEDDLAATPYPFARKVWERGVRAEEDDEERDLTGMPIRLRWLPRGHFASRFAGTFIAHTLFSLEKLKELRQELSAGDARQEPSRGATLESPDSKAW